MELNKIERVFNVGGTSFEQIFMSLINEKVDEAITDYYLKNGLESATSFEERSVLS